MSEWRAFVRIENAIKVMVFIQWVSLQIQRQKRSTLGSTWRVLSRNLSRYQWNRRIFHECEQCGLRLYYLPSIGLVHANLKINKIGHKALPDRTWYTGLSLGFETGFGTCTPKFANPNRVLVRFLATSGSPATVPVVQRDGSGLETIGLCLANSQSYLSLSYHPFLGIELIPFLFRTALI